jgi:hypothetical protein
LALAEQERLSALLARRAESTLSEDEMAELDAMLVQADQLTLLKTRAKYTLQRLKALPAVS